MQNGLFIQPVESAINLRINGSIGSFHVTSRDGSSSSIRVQYIQTHVGFAVSGDAEERLLQQLAPIREVFNLTELGFDELMQRDINDTRVATELIPYLLRESGEALVKLFPPIIVVVLPTDSKGRPASLYPEIENIVEDDSKAPGIKWNILRSGAVGSEAFEFKQMETNRGLDPHNYAQLRINTTGCKMAIVDGQHRAMALLALYRNYKQWPENTLQYCDYYKRWASSVIDKYDLSGVRLPVMLCTFPDLHVGNDDCRLKVSEACRSVFLALNKNARPVTKARNHLLNDDDVIAHFLREVLGRVKQQDAGSEYALRLWNIELDSEGDKRAISTPMALTGVMHLYSMIEFLMLNSKWDGHMRLPRQNLWKKKDLTDCIRRLDAKSQLGADRCERANRSLIEKETATILCERFWEQYGQKIVKAIDSLWPYRVHNNCALELETTLKAEAYGSTYHSILFEGQAIGRVFGDYVDRLREERDGLKDSLGQVPPALEASYSEFENKNQHLNKLIDQFYSDRTSVFLNNTPKKLVEAMDSAIRDIYRNTFTTEAFQLALIVTFFAAVEKCRDEAERNDEVLPKDVIDDAFEEYLGDLNAFLRPESGTEAKNIVRAFYGEVKAGQVIRSTTCLKKILVPGELKPDEWTKFRYMLVEIWNPTQDRFAAYVDEQRQHLRLTAVRAYQDRELDHEAKRKGVLVSDLGDSIVSKISRNAKETFCKALAPIGVDVKPDDLTDDSLMKEASEEYEEDEDVDDDDV